MTNKQFIDTIFCGHFLYWDMLGSLRGIKNNKESDLMWLSGGINYTYYANTLDADDLILRMKNKEIPSNLLFLTSDLNSDPTESLKAIKVFKNGVDMKGMAHELREISYLQPDKRLELSSVYEISTLKSAGAILNTVFGYRLFSLEHFREMMDIRQLFIYIAEYDGLPVGACLCQHGGEFINISWVGTLPGYRKLGVAGCLIQMAECEGIKCGKKVSVLQARAEAIGAYHRIGYKEYCRGIELVIDN